MNTKLDEILEVAPEATQTVIEQAAEIIHAEVASIVPVNLRTEAVINIPALPVDPHNEDLKSDVDYAREQLKDLIDSGRVAMQGALELAEAGDSPRAYEVVAKLLESVVNANKELINIHKTKKEATKEDAALSPDGNANIKIDKAVFVGRASDLLRELKTVRQQQQNALTAAAEVKSDHASES